MRFGIRTSPNTWVSGGWFFAIWMLLFYAVVYMLIITVVVIGVAALFLAIGLLWVASPLINAIQRKRGKPPFHPPTFNKAKQAARMKAAKEPPTSRVDQLEKACEVGPYRRTQATQSNSR